MDPYFDNSQDKQEQVQVEIISNDTYHPNNGDNQILSNLNVRHEEAKSFHDPKLNQNL